MKKLISLFSILPALSLGLLALMLGGCGSEKSYTPEPPVSLDYGLLSVIFPPTAQVEVNGKAVGEVPWSGKYHGGEYQVRITLLGQEIWNKSVTVENYKATTVSPTITLFGIVYVDGSNPKQPVEGAFIQLVTPAGQAVAETATDAQGQFSIDWTDWMGATVFRYGKAGWGNTRSVEILGALQARELPLAKPIPTTGAIRVQTTPPGAKVLVDGAEVGLSPFERDGYSPGPHTVKIILNGYEETEKSLEVVVGRTTAWSPMLTKLRNLFEGFVNGRTWLFKRSNNASFKVIINIERKNITFKDPEGVSWDMFGQIINLYTGEVEFELGAATSTGKYYPNQPETWSGTDSSHMTWTLTLLQ